MITHHLGPDGLKDCFREPIPQIFEAARLLDSAAAAHLRGDSVTADRALRAADMPVIGEWLDSIWLGRNEPYRPVRSVAGLPPVLPKAERFRPRDATPEMKRALVARDGHHCRLCGIPLVRPEDPGEQANADDIEAKRQELNRIYDELEKIEHGRGNVELVKSYRARSRRLADEISDMERRDNA